MISIPSFLLGSQGFVLALALSACATQVAPEATRDATVSSTQPAAGPLTLTSTPATENDQEESDRFKEKVTLFPGTGKFINTQAASKPAPVQQVKGEITLNFEGANIRDVVKVVFDVLQESYVIDPQVQGEVTVQTTRPLSKDMLIPTLETLLRMNQAALVKEGGVYKVMPTANAAANSSPRLSQLRQEAGYGVRIIPLRYVGAQEMQKILEPLVPQGGVLRADTTRNLLILAGTARELATIRETVDIFDVNWLKGMSIGLYKLQNVDSQMVAAQLEKMFGEGSQLPLAGMFRFVPVNQLNAVLVITSQAEYLSEAGIWIARLDSSSGEGLYVYNVQNGKADYLASVLNAVFGAGGAPAAPAAGRVAPGLRPAQLATPSSAERLSSTSSASSRTGGGTQGSLTPVSLPDTDSQPGAVRAAELGMGAEQVRIVADTENNALLIWANTRNHEKIINAVRKLDVTPRQVLVEATIAEVTLTGELQYGLQWFFKNDVGRYQGSGSLDLRTNVQLNQVLGSGFTYAISDSAGIVRALLDTLASESKVKVLSSPQLMVIDNQEAKIRVGTQQPILSSTTVNEIGTVESIQLKDTGVLLQVRPQVNAGGLVTMDINQEVTDVGEIDPATGQRSFLQRSISSRVAVQSGQSIVLGGLIRDRQTNSNSGVPVLYKLPVIGALFGSVDNEADRTELVVLITPRVVETTKDAQEVIKDLRKKMKEVMPMAVNS